jgi:hypothetical protein
MADTNNKTEGTRSPNYPAVGLGDALEAVTKLYKADKRTPVNNETAAARFGFKGLSGPARVMIGALRQYGFIEKTERGHFRVSETALRAIHGTPEQKTEALRQAALAPALFQELSRSHMDAQEDTIRSYLITKKGFIDTGAKNAAKAFRDAMEVANVSASGYAPQENGDTSANNSADHEDWPMDPNTKPDTSVASSIPPLSWVLSVPRGIRAELRITGKDVKRDDLKRLKQQIDFLVESFDDGESETP